MSAELISKKRLINVNIVEEVATCYGGKKEI